MNRVPDGEFPGEERDLLPGEGSGCSVANVPEDRVPYVGHLKADLVPPSRLQNHFHEASGTKCVQYPV